MPMQHWCDSRHPRQPNNTSGYRSPASSRRGRSQEEKPSAKVVLKAAHCCHLPFKKICASLSSCLLGCPQKHTFSLLAKALCSSVFYSASLSISSWLLGLVSDTMFVFFFFFLPSWFWHLLCFPLLSVSPAPLPHPLQLWMAGSFAFFVHYVKNTRFP